MSNKQNEFHEIVSILISMEKLWNAMDASNTGMVNIGETKNVLFQPPTSKNCDSNQQVVLILHRLWKSNQHCELRLTSMRHHQLMGVTYCPTCMYTDLIWLDWWVLVMVLHGTELDNHANMVVFKKQATVIQFNGKMADVRGFSNKISALKKVQVYDIVLAYECPYHIKSYVPEIHFIFHWWIKTSYNHLLWGSLVWRRMKLQRIRLILQWQTLIWSTTQSLTFISLYYIWIQPLHILQT